MGEEMELSPIYETPYYAVIFTSLRTEIEDEYAETAERMVELASQIDGFLGVDSARDGIGITVSYWKNPEAISRWKAESEHKLAQSRGYKEWYKAFTMRICKVESNYDFEK
jgi:heme-degrading monooxygenase HmoA